MKNGLLWGISIVGVIILIVVAVVGWAMTTNKRVDVNSFSVTNLTNTSQTITNNTKEVKINARTAFIQIQSGDEPKVIFQNVGESQYQVTQKQGVLEISQAASHSHHLEIGRSAMIKVIVPRETLVDLTVAQLNGTLKLTDLSVKQLNINHHNGTTIAKRLTVLNGGAIEKDNGKTELNQLTTPGVRVAVKNGQFKLNGERKAGSGDTYSDDANHQLKINSKTGQVRVTTVK